MLLAMIEQTEMNVKIGILFVLALKVLLHTSLIWRIDTTNEGKSNENSKFMTNRLNFQFFHCSHKVLHLIAASTSQRYGVMTLKVTAKSGGEDERKRREEGRLKEITFVMKSFSVSKLK